MFGGNWSPGKIWVSFLGAGTLLHSFALASGSLSGPGIADQHGGCPVSQRSEGIQQRRLHPGGCNHATELWGFARSGEGETDRAGEAAGLLAEVSSLPSPIGSQGINSYSLVENSELWGMRSDHPTRKTPQLMCLPWEDTDLHYKMKSPSCGKKMRVCLNTWHRYKHMGKFIHKCKKRGFGTFTPRKRQPTLWHLSWLLLNSLTSERFSFQVW